MRNCNTVHWMLLLALAIIIIIIHSGTVDSDVGEGRGHESRWARVDLTHYCGKTIGELVEALGADYEEIVVWQEPPLFVCGFGFRYDGNSIIDIFPESPISPRKYEYYTDSIWGYEDIKEYRISRMEARFFQKKERSNEK